MDPLQYENINQVNEFNFLATPTRTVQRDDGLYLKRNGEMIYLGTYGEARTRSNNNSGSQGLQINVIGIDGTNYGSFDTSTIDENLFILRPERSVEKVRDGEKTKNGGKRKYRRSHRRRSHRRRSHYKRSRRR